MLFGKLPNTVRFAHHRASSTQQAYLGRTYVDPYMLFYINICWIHTIRTYLHSLHRRCSMLLCIYYLINEWTRADDAFSWCFIDRNIRPCVLINSPFTSLFFNFANICQNWSMPVCQYSADSEWSWMRPSGWSTISIYSAEEWVCALVCVCVCLVCVEKVLFQHD